MHLLADFLAVVYDESTIGQLKEEMDHTETKNWKLTPTVEEMEKNFKENQQDGVEQLQFYTEVGLDTWLP